jgi:hypothetical protein
MKIANAIAVKTIGDGLAARHIVIQACLSLAPGVALKNTWGTSRGSRGVNLGIRQSVREDHYRLLSVDVHNSNRWHDRKSDLLIAAWRS